MKKARLVVLAVIFVVSTVAIAHRLTWSTESSLSPGNSKTEPGHATNVSRTSGEGWSGENSAAMEISKRGPGMRRQPPGALKLPVPRTFDLTHVDPANFAAALGNDPVRIFNYVRDEIAYETYTGCLRGPRGTLMAMAGNSVDRASLLASMLQHTGRRVRFAQGTLPEPQATELVSSMWAERPRWGPLVESKDQPPANVKVAADTLVPSVKRDYTLIRDHLKQANLKITAESVPSLGSLVKETQRHYWIQWFKDGAWVDLDPSFADASPGGKYAIAEQTFDALPEALFHQVEIRIRLEEYTGGQVSSRLILTRKAKAADLSGADVVLFHQPENWQGPATSLESAIASAIVATGRVKPVLLIDEKDWVAGEPFYSKPPATGGMGGVFNALGGIGTRHDVPIATAESIEFDFVSPGGKKETVVREIFDVVGKARRAKGSNLSADEVHAKVEVQEAIDLTRNLYALFFTTGRIAIGHLLKVAGDPGRAEANAPDVDAFLRRISITFITTSDALLGRVGPPDDSAILFYPNSPRVQIVDLSAVAGTRRISIDLRRSDVRAVAAGADTEAVFYARVLRGVFEGTLERLLIEYVTGSTPQQGAVGAMSTSLIFERAQAEGVPTLLLNRDGPALSTSVPEDCRARVREEFGRRFLVVAPGRQLLLGKQPRFAWWRIDPNSGETTAVTDEGLHQTTTGYYRMVDEGNGRVTVVTREWIDDVFVGQQERTFASPQKAFEWIDQLIEKGFKFTDTFPRCPGCMR